MHVCRPGIDVASCLVKHTGMNAVPVLADPKPYVLVQEFVPKKPLVEPSCQPQSPTAHHGPSGCGCHVVVSTTIASRSTAVLRAPVHVAWYVKQHRQIQ